MTCGPFVSPRGDSFDMEEMQQFWFAALGGKVFFREGEEAKLKLVATKSFSKGIVKLTYEPQY
jgi:hypothetical protein